MTDPCWMLLIVEIRGVLRLVVALGPIFSSQVRSIVWLASVCPNVRFILGEIRWAMVGKKPSMFEKWWGVRWGVGLSCLDVREASSRAISSPKIVMVIAASLVISGIDIIGVFVGRRLEVIKRPATMLPHASRLIGLITDGLFSLIGESALKRGCPMET